MNLSSPIGLDDPALNLLLAASSPYDSGRIEQLLENPIDWQAVLRLAEQHGTSSLLYRNLSLLNSRIPETALASLLLSYDRNVHKSLFLTRELIRILDCLDALGVLAVPYKGVVFSETYYGDMALRPAGDMDLFVRAEDVIRIKDAIRNLGYTPRMLIPQEAEAHYLAAGYEYTFDSPAGKNLLELQWALQPRFYAVDFDMAGLFERAVSVSLADHNVKTPSPEDLLLVLSLHAAKHVWARLIWLCDIAQILRRENLNWDWVRAQAAALGVARILHITLLLANRFLGTGIPAAIEEAIASDRPAATLATEIIASVAAGTIYEEEKISYFRLMMRLRERTSDRMRFLTRLAFTPGPGEWQTMRLPRALFPFYRVVRLGRLAGRFARG